MVDEQAKCGKSKRTPLAVQVPARVVDSFNASDTSFIHGDLHVDQHGAYRNCPMGTVRRLADSPSPSPNHLLHPNSVMPIANLDDLEFTGTLGRGSTSVVHRAVHKLSGISVAVKEINVFDREKRRSLLAELMTLTESSSETLVTFYGAFYKGGSIYIVLELMELGSLQDLLNSLTQPLPESVISSIAKQVLLSFSYLHKEKHLIHRDIKPANIMLARDGRVKLTDFGVSTELVDSAGLANSFVGTCTYMSPERIVGAEYSFASDIWSLGITLLQCALGKYPYPNNGVYIELMQSIVSGSVPVLPVANSSESFRSFISKCLRKDPESRANCTELLSHPFIQSVNEDSINRASAWIVETMPERLPMSR